MDDFINSYIESIVKVMFYLQNINCFHFDWTIWLERTLNFSLCFCGQVFYNVTKQKPTTDRSEIKQIITNETPSLFIDKSVYWYMNIISKHRKTTETSAFMRKAYLYLWQPNTTDSLTTHLANGKIQGDAFLWWFYG